MPDTQMLLAIAAIVSAVIALITLVFSVCNNFLSTRRESNRRDWERFQALAQILHKGPEAGVWAQIAAVEELAGLKTRKVQVLLLAKEALTYWRERKDPSSSDLRLALQKLIDKLSD